MKFRHTLGIGGHYRLRPRSLRFVPTPHRRTVRYRRHNCCHPTRGTRRLLPLRQDRPSSPSVRCSRVLLQLLSLSLICTMLLGRGVNRARTDGVDADLAVFQVDCPCTRKRSYSGLGCAVNTESLEPFGSSD